MTSGSSPSCFAQTWKNTTHWWTKEETPYSTKQLFEPSLCVTQSTFTADVGGSSWLEALSPNVSRHVTLLYKNQNPRINLCLNRWPPPIKIKRKSSQNIIQEKNACRNTEIYCIYSRWEVQLQIWSHLCTNSFQYIHIIKRTYLKEANHYLKYE